LEVLKGLGKEIYGFEMNFDNIDKDDDGRVQMTEFIRYANKISGVDENSDEESEKFK
jgi:Ca2+-binding EF-hand superfamily protein